MDLSWDRKRVLLSTFIVGVLGAQLVAAFGHTNNYFPFMWYPMYAPPHFEGERITVHHSIYAVQANGTRHHIRPEHLGLEFWRYERLARQLLVNHVEPNAPALAVIRKRHPNLTELQINDYPMVITRNGPRPAPEMVVHRISRAAIEEAIEG
jgi:hypothetical protein